MRFLVMVKASPESETGRLPNLEELAEMGKFNDGLQRDGIFLAAEGLHATAKGKRVAWTGGKPAVMDGPFAESKELVAGFWLLQGRSIDEIVERISRAPFTNGAVEIRQIVELEELERSA